MYNSTFYNTLTALMITVFPHYADHLSAKVYLSNSLQVSMTYIIVESRALYVAEQAFLSC
jgi:hypothetical protein